MKPIWIVIITVVVMAALGAGGYYYLNSQYVKEKNDLQSQVDDLNAKINAKSSNSSSSENSLSSQAVVDTSNWKTLTLPLTNGTLKYPDSWTLTKEADTSGVSTQITTYAINKGGEVYGVINEYKISEWVKGAGSDEPYQLSASDRVSLLAAVKDLYNAGKLTDNIKNDLNKYSVEFLTYAKADRVYMDYLKSTDGKSKGVAMIGTHSQDYGIPIEYHAFVYNPDHDAIIEINRQLTSFSTEVATLSKQYGTSPTDAQDKKVHADFVSLMTTTPRESLSFAKYMDEIDTSIETLHF
ncbi:MAG: hypothetical protein WC080_02600 [Patescibacteria group bacterium]|jgi:outer membrane murein-binding lipoprotein Lpp